jgi:hypothetical protein
MTPGTTTALAAIFGSLVGAFSSIMSTWIIQRHQDRRELLAKRIYHREHLYSDLITQTARLLIDALEHSAIDAENPDSVLRTIEPHSPEFFTGRACNRGGGCKRRHEHLCEAKPDLRGNTHQSHKW